MTADFHNPDQSNPIKDSAPTQLPIPDKFSFPVIIVWGTITMLSIGLFLLGLPQRFNGLLSVDPNVQLALDQAGIPNIGWALSMLIPEVVMMLVYTIIGISLFLQKPKDVNILVVSLLLITWGTTILNVVEAFALNYSWVNGWILFSRALSWSLVMTILLIFPNGRLYPNWTKWLLIFWYVWIWSWFFFPQLPHNISIHGGLADPIRFLIYFSLLGIGAAAQVQRYRKGASPTERQQVKWAFLGIALMFLIAFIEEAPSAFDPSLVEHTTPESILYAIISTSLFVIGSLAFPIGIATSIQLKRLWQIDYVINRSLVYALSTIFLGFSFFALFILLESLLFSLMDNRYSVVVAITSALLTFALFRPVRYRLQHFIDTQIYKIQIDYQAKRRLQPSFGFHLLEVEQQVGDYAITEIIARGGMSEIFKGKHITTGEEAAVKILVERYAQQEDIRKQFSYEAQTISRMEHNNIIKLIDYGETGEINYLIMEFISYQTLAKQIISDAPLSLNFTSFIIGQISQALDYAHELGIIHRDIKPSNVLLRPSAAADEFPHPVLIDFGIAREESRCRRLRKLDFVGSLDYISPEQIQSSDTVDQRADIYSLGVMTYQMLTGQLPFQSNNRAAALIAHIQQPAPNILAYNPELPDKVSFAILKALAKSPADRFDRASDFAAALKI